MKVSAQDKSPSLSPSPSPTYKDKNMLENELNLHHHCNKLLRRRRSNDKTMMTRRTPARSMTKVARSQRCDCPPREDLDEQKAEREAVYCGTRLPPNVTCTVLVPPVDYEDAPDQEL
ncbi:hypothetical protein HDU76_006212 [Blyttiomyces sp. JEL0837]|nr:hypothetical protein HDU76_006212 [Blyttiomyces sp. JEL0837]